MNAQQAHAALAQAAHDAQAMTDARNAVTVAIEMNRANRQRLSRGSGHEPWCGGGNHVPPDGCAAHLG